MGQARGGAANRMGDLGGAGLSKVQSVDQRMRLECGVGFRQLRTCRRTRPGQLCAKRRHRARHDGSNAAGLTKRSGTIRSRLRREYIPVAILGQRADVRHQPVRPGNDELVGDHTIENFLARFHGHLWVLIDRLLPVRIC